jgi:hypothetical protein
LISPHFFISRQIRGSYVDFRVPDHDLFNTSNTNIYSSLQMTASVLGFFIEMRTVEAIIQPNGEVRLAEPVHVLAPRRALLTILEDEPQANEAALLSEAALAEDWSRPEEDAAWAHLQPAKSS